MDNDDAVTVTPLPVSTNAWGTIDPFFDNPRANRALVRGLYRVRRVMLANQRARARVRRQHRATYRRRKRGLA